MIEVAQRCLNNGGPAFSFPETIAQFFFTKLMFIFKSACVLYIFALASYIPRHLFVYCYCCSCSMSLYFVLEELVMISPSSKLCHWRRYHCAIPQLLPAVISEMVIYYWLIKNAHQM